MHIPKRTLAFGPAAPERVVCADQHRRCHHRICSALPRHDAPAADDAGMQFPTTAVIVDGQLLVVGSQFDRGAPIGPGEPQRPFTINVFTLE